MSAGRLIAIEGMDCAGKSLQTRILSEALTRGYGVRCLTTREPGGTALAEQVRSWLFEYAGDAMLQALLFSAARRDHLAKVIAPALAEGKWVICDRFFLSTLAYQGGGGGVGAQRLLALHEAVFGGFEFHDADCGIVLDIDYETSCLRRSSRGKSCGSPEGHDPFEDRGEDFFTRARAAFLHEGGERGWHVVDARRSADEVAAEIEALVAAQFSLASGHARGGHAREDRARGASAV